VVLIGIDRYDAGPRWALAGPVDDAVRLAGWFLDRGVPPDQVFLLAAPGDGEPFDGIRRLPATRASVRDVFLRELPAQPQRQLYVHWGGHGYLDPGRRRCVYYADATAADSVSLDLDAIVAAYATDLVPFDRQFWLVDACLSHLAQRAQRRPPERDEFAAGSTVAGRDIDVLFAAAFGEAAVNLDAARTGLFTHELLAALGTRWPPEPDRLIGELRRRFGELRARALTRQTPTYMWYRTAIGDEGQLLQRPGPEPGWAVRRHSGGANLAGLRQLVDALVEIDEFLRPAGRDEIMSLMRREVSSAVPRQPAARLDAVAMVRTCQRFPGGLAELAEVVRFLAPEDPAAERVVGLVDRFGSAD